MRFIDFVILLLQAHADVLKKTAAYLGEDELLTLLETADERETQETPRMVLDRKWFDPPSSNRNSAYLSLDHCVREINLSPPLEFHVWSYPFYRLLVESSIDLNAEISKGNQAIESLVQLACQAGETWIRNIPMPGPARKLLEAESRARWVRFRSEALKKTGLRPIASVG